jgi:hypothetical protein
VSAAPAVEAATVVPQRRLVAAGIKRGSTGSADFSVEYPQMSAADKASHVRQCPVALDDAEREDLSKKLAEINKRSSGSK